MKIRYGKSDKDKNSKDLPTIEEEEDAFNIDDEDESAKDDDHFFGDDDDLDSIFAKLKYSGPDAQRILSILQNSEFQDKLKEFAYNATIYVVNFLSDGYAVMKLTRELNKHYPQIPKLSFRQSVAVARVLASIMRSAVYYMQLQPAKTYKEMIRN